MNCFLSEPTEEESSLHEENKQKMMAIISATNKTKESSQSNFSLTLSSGSAAEAKGPSGTRLEVVLPSRALTYSSSMYYEQESVDSRGYIVDEDVTLLKKTSYYSNEDTPVVSNNNNTLTTVESTEGHSGKIDVPKQVHADVQMTSSGTL